MEKVPYQDRTLEENLPELMDYLRPGIVVLDVGCGPGNLTLDVGRVISPGKVIGLDKQESSIQYAMDLASSHKAENVTFVLGDAHVVDFDENSFDVVYSHTAFHSFMRSSGWKPHRLRWGGKPVRCKTGVMIDLRDPRYAVRAVGCAGRS